MDDGMQSYTGAQGEGARSRSETVRAGIRTTIRVLLWIWAAMATAVIGVGVSGSDRSIGENLAVAIFVAALGYAPLIGHIMWGRSHPIGRQRAQPSAVAPTAQQRPVQRISAPAPLRHAPDSVLGLLQQTAAAAQQLRTRAWVGPQDSQAIDQRIARLTDLANVDGHSVRIGGSPSAGLRREVELLHSTVVGLLDASIESSAVAPGDSDVDGRLQAHLDRLHSRGSAVAELEGRIRATGTDSGQSQQAAGGG